MTRPVSLLLAIFGAFTAFLTTSCETNAPVAGSQSSSGVIPASSTTKPAATPRPSASAHTVHTPAELGPPPSVNAAAYIVVNPRNGDVLLARNAHSRRQVASTQKLLTALTVLDAGGLDRTVTVAASDTYVEPVKMGIRAGEKYTKRHLLEAMVVRSSNDIAKCLARTTGGSEARFVQMMNARAQRMGMQNTNFRNPHGLTEPGAYSTAFDLAILGTHVLNNAYLHRLTRTREMVFHMANGTPRSLTNTNKVLRMNPYCSGMKTGYTAAAGRCLVSCGQRGTRKVIVVVLGSSIPDVWNGSNSLINWGLGLNS